MVVVVVVVVKVMLFWWGAGGFHGPAVPKNALNPLMAI